MHKRQELVTPVRQCFNWAEEKFLGRLPDFYVQVTLARDTSGQLTHTGIFVGDDLTDEAGFAAALSLGGFGVLVGRERRTHAVGRLESPAAVLDWIEAALAAGAFPIPEARP